MSSSGNKVQELVRETAACSVNGSANTGKLIFREKPETTKQEDSNGKKPVKDAKTFRMNLFREAEVVFPGTFRQNAPVGRTLSIRSNAVISAASGSDIQDTAGSFGFPEESGLENRFIIWRALGPNITFEEYSADCDPQGAVLCLHFEHCSIIKGTKIYFSGERLVIVVPTHRSVHRFYIDLSELERPESLNDIAVLSLLPTGEDLDVVHHEHVFTTTGNASACEITMLATDQTLLAGHFQDGQLVSVIMPSLIHSNQHSRGDERVLKIPRSPHENRGKMASRGSSGHLPRTSIRIFNSVFGMLRYILSTQQVVQTIDLLRQIGEDPADLRPVAIKTTLLKTRIVITINVKHGATTKLLFFSPVADELTFLAQINGDPKGELLDTEITEGVRSEHALCWGIRRNGPKAKCRYNLATCELDFRDCKEEWTEVMNVVSLDPLPCKTALRRERIAHLKRRIFGGDEFTIEVLLRTINMECKGTDQRTFLHDYPNIQNYVEEFVENIYLKQMRERNAVLAMDKSGVESAAESFWKKFLTTCEEFQATAGFLPIVIWTAPELELVGVIQQARFTVCIDNDEEMERMLHPHFTNQEAEKLYGIISEASNVWKRMDAEIEDQLIRLRGAIVGYMKNIRSLAMNFADLSPFDGHDRPRAAMFEYRNSLFAAGLLSATLRRYVLKRYEFAQSLCDIVIFGVPRVLKSGQLKKVVEDRDFVSRVRAMYTSFKVLTNALCFRVTCRLPSAAGDSVEGSTNSKRMCVAEAFFALGGPTLFSSGNTIPSTVEVEMMENSELAALEGEERENYIRSRTRRRSSIATHPFHRFVQDCSFGSVLFLWPGSPELMLPRFLRKQGMFYALQHYCTFNDSSLDADLTCTEKRLLLLSRTLPKMVSQGMTKTIP
ncbi:hypothetical protein L596_028036 [Steinernema carpocapsae]|uniref:Nucleoporin Nup120/160 beta-propeller domain-containing protein n=1 Tax=Steinernema carpocapsae TaxID=34508 RepID=A0A4U5LXB8_STECR|nr:hypothetical protein L596_028036 [Steinernema carpocapsae]